MVVRRVNPELVALVILVRFVVCCVGLYFCVYVCVCVLVSVCYLSHAQIEKNDSRFKSIDPFPGSIESGSECVY